MSIQKISIAETKILDRFHSLIPKIKWIIISNAPKDSGLLIENIFVQIHSRYLISIWIEDSADMNYMMYTEEEWINRPGVNPNQGWFADTVDDVIRFIQQELGGDLEFPQE